jgi:hypothetical protein
MSLIFGLFAPGVAPVQPATPESIPGQGGRSTPMIVHTGDDLRALAKGWPVSRTQRPGRRQLMTTRSMSRCRASGPAGWPGCSLVANRGAAR